jgi:hypothetical protein
MSGFDFVGAAYVAASITQENQELINWYPEVDGTKFAGSKATNAPADRGVIALYPTPGLTTLLQLAYGPVRVMHVRSGGDVLYAVCGATLYSISASYAATVVGTLSTISGPVTMDDNGVSLYITDGVSRYYYTWGTSTFSSIADGPFTGGANCCEVDNFFIYSRPNSNQWGSSNVGSVVSGGSNLGSKIGYSDTIVSMIVNRREVFLLGEVASEVWTDVGSSPFPFSIIPGTSMQHGCAAAGSVARLGENFAFLAQDTRGNATVIMMNSYTPQRISTFAVENAIQGYAVTSDAIAYTYSQSGHEFYVLTFPSADVTWCYDLATGLWHKRAWRDANNVLHRHRSNCAALFQGDVVVGDWQNGKVYRLDQANYTDAGDPIPCIRRAPHLTTDLKRQFFSDLQIQFQPGVGLQTGQGSDPECILRWSNDGGFTWQNDRRLKIGKVGKYKNRAIKRRLGWARDRVFEIEVTDPVYRVVVSANLNASSGAN